MVSSSCWPPPLPLRECPQCSPVPVTFQQLLDRAPLPRAAVSRALPIIGPVMEGGGLAFECLIRLRRSLALVEGHRRPVSHTHDPSHDVVRLGRDRLRADVLQQLFSTAVSTSAA